MKNLIFILVFIAFFSHKVSANNYICYYLINSEIKASMEENTEQKKMKEKQLGNLAFENTNKEKWYDYKSKMVKIQKRLNSTSLALQALPSAYKITQEIKQIYSLQEKIIDELEESPSDIISVFTGQIEFIDKTQMTLRLMAGIIISYGTINQMERAERKILLDFVTQEFKNIRMQSWSTLSTIRMIKTKRKQNMFMLNNWLNKDKLLIKEILTNANAY